MMRRRLKPGCRFVLSSHDTEPVTDALDIPAGDRRFRYSQEQREAVAAGRLDHSLTARQIVTAARTGELGVAPVTISTERVYAIGRAAARRREEAEQLRRWEEDPAGQASEWARQILVTLEERSATPAHPGRGLGPGQR